MAGASSSSPWVTLRNLLQNIDCASACCGGRVIRNEDDTDGRKNTSRNLLRSIASGWLRRNRQRVRRGQETVTESDSNRGTDVVEEAGHLYSTPSVET